MGKTIQVYGFPGLVAAEVVKEFLEELTGKGTVYALEVKSTKKGGPRTYAKVQFTSVKSAELVLTLARQRLWYGSSYLKAYEADNNIIQKPKVYAFDMENVALYVGCKVSKEKFLVLWKKSNISVKFGFGLRKLYFLLEYQSVNYKLELSYENIWQTELRRSHGEEFLLFQLTGAPRIYQRHEESVFNFFKELPDEQWMRTTDFTPSSCIGQSSGFCLKLPYGESVPQFANYFVNYKEHRGLFILESGFSFSHNPSLVPIVGPPLGVQIPFNILFKLSTLVQAGYLSGPVLQGNFFRLVDPQKVDIVQIEYALEKLYNLKDCCYEPVKWLSEQYESYLMLRRPPRSPSVVLDNGLVYVRKVLVTPAKVYFLGPEVNMSNRVLRHYYNEIDNFLRVSFVDEEWDKIHSTNLSTRIASVETKTGIYQRILSTLRNGIDIVDKKFEFLAFSSSQLRDNSAWMFASRPGLTAADIRHWMGDFSEIKNVAKYAARLGQSFGSSTETLSVPRHEVETIRDIKVTTDGIEYTFSDGIGKISADFAHRVAMKCNLKSFTPSAFQIRYGGYKGVVAIDPTSSMKLSLRKSMSKYECENEKLDVLGWSKYQPCYLNRQLVSLLSTLGVEDSIFEVKQKDALKQLDLILTDPLMAQEALELMSPGENTNILKEMLLCGYKPNTEPFLFMMLRTFRAAKLLELRTKTRIFIPRARQMMGCLDETRTLEYGQVFVQVSEGPSHRHLGDNFCLLPNNNETEHRRFVAKGKVLVAKNPCLHPGDVRVLMAVDVPALHHMVDCVVFPQKGKRPHPNECSGSDLDGDIYFVCWDKDLIPTRVIEPMDYTPAPPKVLDHNVTIEEVEEYFTNYILNDSLGVIANAHTVFADSEDLKALSTPCLELAQLFSIAVDFPKTGVPAEIPPHLRVKIYPDFLEKSDKQSYESKCVIGKLFRMVKDLAPQDPSSTKSFFTRELARTSYDPELEVDDFEDYLEDAFDYKNEYDFKLGNLMDYYGIKTEGEILGGSIMRMSKTFDRRKDADAVGLAVRSLRKEARTWFNRKCYNKDEDEYDDLYAKASAWYYVTYHHTYWGRYNEGMNREHYLSFPWCVYDKLISIKKDKAALRRVFQNSLLQQEFNGRLQLI